MPVVMEKTVVFFKNNALTAGCPLSWNNHTNTPFTHNYKENPSWH